NARVPAERGSDIGGDERLADVRGGRNDAEQAPAALGAQLEQLGADHVKRARPGIEAVEPVNAAALGQIRRPTEHLRAAVRRQRDGRQSLVLTGRRIGGIMWQWAMQVQVSVSGTA